jgi:hypothetical protein
MAVRAQLAPPSAEELEAMLAEPHADAIRRYAAYLFRDQARSEDWFHSEIPSLGFVTPESLMHDGSAASMRRVIGTLIKIDYGVCA